jgi:hypothetical protein
MTLRERGPCQRNTHSPHWARHTAPAGRGVCTARSGAAQAGAARARARPSRASRRPANGAGAWNSSTRHRASPPRRAPAATRVRGRPIVGHNQESACRSRRSHVLVITSPAARRRAARASKGGQRVAQSAPRTSRGASCRARRQFHTGVRAIRTASDARGFEARVRDRATMGEARRAPSAVPASARRAQRVRRAREAGEADGQVDQLMVPSRCGHIKKKAFYRVEYPRNSTE